ncbi:MAG TPA: efflux RND transporter periplasmic adaptor subunit [Roseiarcus sp.]|nr:efflux RND transporter periplasmic adaptor subunit [Roseiarcus sp.]
MMVGILVVALACFVFWLVFLKLKWLRPTPGWVFGFSVFVVHLMLIFVIGLRFVTPQSANASIVQHTIQLIPRLSEPTLVTAVLVEDNTEVKRDQPLFQFDRTVYQSKAASLEAQLASAKQNVEILRANVASAEGKLAQMAADLEYAQHQTKIYERLAQEDSTRADDVTLWRDKTAAAIGTKREAEAGLEAARLAYESEINGVNTTVANVEAQLQEAEYYLDNTTLRAPEDGRIVNLQVRPGMVSGIYRVGGIAALICSADRYLLATYYQENLKWVRPGQFAEIAFNLYPGQIFKGHVDSIWKANGGGQYLPSDEIPKYEPPPPNIPQGQYAVKIIVDDPDQSKFPIGAQGAATIYTAGDQGSWAALRKIAIRVHTWVAWLYPL